MSLPILNFECSIQHHFFLQISISHTPFESPWVNIQMQQILTQLGILKRVINQTIRKGQCWKLQFFSREMQHLYNIYYVPIFSIKKIQIYVKNQE